MYNMQLYKNERDLCTWVGVVRIACGGLARCIATCGTCSCCQCRDSSGELLMGPMTTMPAWTMSWRDSLRCLDIPGMYPLTLEEPPISVPVSSTFSPHRVPFCYYSYFRLFSLFLLPGIHIYSWERLFFPPSVFLRFWGSYFIVLWATV